MGILSKIPRRRMSKEERQVTIFFFSLGFVFSTLSFFDLYRIVLEPIRLHFFVRDLFPNWYDLFQDRYRVFSYTKRHEHTIMLIWAKFLGLIVGIGFELCRRIMKKKLDVFIYAGSVPIDKYFFENWQAYLGLFVGLLGLFFFVPYVGDHQSTSFVSRPLFGRGITTYIIFFSTVSYTSACLTSFLFYNSPRV